MNRSRYSRQCLGIIVLCITGSTASFAANANAMQGKQFQDWGGNCEHNSQHQSVCYLEQVLNYGQDLAMVTIIGYPPGSAQPTAIFELPAQLNVKAGFSLQVERHPPVRFQGKCTADRCTAFLPLTPALVAQFRTGRQAMLSYTPAPQQAPIQLPLSLMGLSAGLQALKP